MQAPNNRYPYIVPILYNGQFTCGGTLITKDTVLTAAHCLEGRDNTDGITVLIGSDNVNNGNIMSVRKEMKHPDYEQMSEVDYSYDVGLIFLTEEVQNNNIQLPKLNDESAVPLVGSTTYALGWGITDTATRSLPNDLQIVDLAVISNEDCSEDYPGYINSDMLCTFNQGKGKQNFLRISQFFTSQLLWFLCLLLKWCTCDKRICFVHKICTLR